MTRDRRRAPALLLSGEALLGVTRHPREHTIATRRRYEQPAALAAAFRDALAAGADGLLVAPSPAARDALRALGEPPPVYAHVPNMPQYVRDAAALGLVGTALKRVRGAPPLTLARHGLTGVAHAPGVLAGDFQALVPLLIELECASLGAPRLEGVVLAATLTDLALAGGHSRMFHHVVRFVRARFGARAGFETHNLGHLLERFEAWNVVPDLVVGPVNPAGFLMKPDPQAVLRGLERARFPVLAKEVRAGGTVGFVEGARYARSCGAAGVVVDLADVERAGALGEIGVGAG